MKKRILIIKDEPSDLSLYISALIAAGYDVDHAPDISKAGEVFAQKKSEIVFLDLLLNKGDPLVLLRGLLAARPLTHVIVVTSSGSMRLVTAAMQFGAFDFMVRPFEPAAALPVINNAAKHLDAIQNDDGHAKKVIDPPNAAFAEIWGQITTIAPSTADVFLAGGDKALRLSCAKVIHRLSQMAGLPFVCLPNKAPTLGQGWLSDMLPQEIMEKGGTIFVDDLSKLPLHIQTELFRMLQSSILRKRDGMCRILHIRVISAVTGLPEKAINQGDLREDLFYRLNALPIFFPDGVEGRNRDLGVIQNTLQGVTQARSKSPIELSPVALEALLSVNWEGRVKELQSILDIIISRGTDPGSHFELLPLWLQKNVDPPYISTDETIQNPEIHLPGPGHSEQTNKIQSALRTLVDHGLSLVDLEREVIEYTIRHYSGSVPKAAQHLKVAPSTLYRKREGWATENN